MVFFILNHAKKVTVFCFLTRLENVLRDYPEVDVVIISTWRETRSLSILRLFFSPDIAKRIIDVTPSCKEHQELFEIIGYQRQTEIEAWLRQSKEHWRQWLAIDDKPYLFKPFLPNLIKTISTIGFDETAEGCIETKKGKRAHISKEDILEQYYDRFLLTGWVTNDEERWVLIRSANIIQWPLPLKLQDAG